MTTLEQAGDVIRPFTVEIPNEALDDLQRRLATTRWPSTELVDDRSQGVQLATMRAVGEYWAKDYDGRRVESRAPGAGGASGEADEGCVNGPPRRSSGKIWCTSASYSCTVVR